jgi:5-methyltetrahydropteroyltriglutamate--homocysteine methyltransferase
MSDFNESIEGLDEDGSIARAWKGASEASGAGVATLTGVVIGKIRQKKRLTSRELDFLTRYSPGDVKMTLPSANQFPAIAYKKGLSERVYPTYSEFLWDVVPIIGSEIEALVNDGVKYIQIDAPRYSYYLDPKWREYIRSEMGVSPEHALDEAIRVDNTCVQGVRRQGLTLAIHLCRGNSRSQWYAEGGYDPIAEKLFNELNVDLFLLEYDSDRAGTFEPLRFVPKDKGVVLGLVSSKIGSLETRDEIRRRIDEASRYVPIENLALSPQCGFASNSDGNLVSEDEQWAKLQLVVDTARDVWGES